MKRTYTLLAIGCGLLFAASTCFAQMYTLTDLVTTPDPMCPSGSYLSAGVNASGQVAGSCLSGHFPIRAFRTAPNRPINPATDDLGTFGGSFSVARGVNDSGQVVGISQNTDGVYHAFRTVPNGLIDLATDDLGIVNAYGINNVGQVVGSFHVADSVPFISHALRTAPNSPFNPATDDLGTLGGGQSVAVGVNELGQAVGYSASESGNHAFRTAPNRLINPVTDDLGTLGGTETLAFGVNDLGEAVGYSFDLHNTIRHAFRTAPNKPINPATDDLGTLGGMDSLATAIDAFGQVVGYSSTAAFRSHAFLYSNGVMHDLNSLVPAAPGCELFYVSDINDRGQITADRYCGGPSQHPVLLNPIYNVSVRPPVRADGSSVFAVKRESVPLGFILLQRDVRTCTLLPATLAITRITGGKLTRVHSRNLPTTRCRYAYDLKPNRLGVGMYRADVSINGIMVGHAAFAVR